MIPNGWSDFRCRFVPIFSMIWGGILLLGWGCDKKVLMLWWSWKLIDIDEKLDILKAKDVLITTDENMFWVKNFIWYFLSK